MDDRPYHARTTDPETSREWAARMNLHYRDDWETIEDDLIEHGPSTYREVSDRTEIMGTSTSPTMSVMEKAGILRRLRKSDSSLMKRHGAMLREVVPVELRKEPDRRGHDQPSDQEEEQQPPSIPDDGYQTRCL